MKKLICMLALMLMPVAANAKTYDLGKDVFKIKMGDVTISFVCIDSTAIVTTVNKFANLPYPTVVVTASSLCYPDTLAALRKVPR